MKALITIGLILSCQFLAAQNVKISGKVLFAPSDEFSVTIISDLGTVLSQEYHGIFWTVLLEDATNYFIIHRSGSAVKMMTLKTARMQNESIEIDVDFRSRGVESTVFLERAKDKHFILQLESKSWVRQVKIDRIRNEF